MKKYTEPTTKFLTINADELMGLGIHSEKGDGQLSDDIYFDEFDEEEEYDYFFKRDEH